MELSWGDLETIYDSDKDLIAQFQPFILALLESQMSGTHADEVCCKIGFDSWVRIEAIGFCSGIWIFWKYHFDVDIILTHPQFMLVSVIHDDFL